MNVLNYGPLGRIRHHSSSAARKFEKPFLCAFSDNDPVTRGLDKKFIATCPGAKGQPHSTVQRGGHFIQEKRPKEISKIISDFIKLTITESSE